MDAVIDRRRFGAYLLGVIPFGFALAAENAKGEVLKGKMIIGPKEDPAAETSDHGRVALSSDESNMKVLHDERINGFEMEARGHFTAPGRFQIDPQHTRALLVRDKDGKLKMITYWCDVCSIRTFMPGPCMCCQKYTDLDLRLPDDIG
jgi:hypothetical protein